VVSAARRPEDPLASVVRIPIVTLGLISSFVAPALAPGREDDRKLLGRIAGGDSNALRQLYGRVSDRAMAIALRLLKDRAEAEDVVQDTFLEVWKRAGQYEPARGGAAAWIVTIARSRAIDRLRAHGRSARAAQGTATEPPPPASPDGPELAAQRRDRERVLGAMSTLPPEQRHVIELAYFDGLSQTEIASRLKEPLGTVKTRVRLAMAKLADLLGDEEGA
jgi:RNA polymerase sigma-70 factor (ECF subfamily)